MIITHSMLFLAVFGAIHVVGAGGVLVVSWGWVPASATGVVASDFVAVCPTVARVGCVWAAFAWAHFRAFESG